MEAIHKASRILNSTGGKAAFQTPENGWRGQLRALASLLRSQDADADGGPTPAQQRLLQRLLRLLQPFQEALDSLRSEDESLGMVVPAYLHLLDKVSSTRVAFVIG